MIISIVVAILIAFSLIVYLAINFHTKQIKRKLETAKSEIEQSALNKAITGDFYSGIGPGGSIYEDCKDIYAVPTYEMADVGRYQSSPHTARKGNEPEYLIMTEANTSGRVVTERLYENSN